ncbi:polyphosphate kinase [Gimesia maris DSM 8797]|nr:polyphosphate kinase [Gimesia maris DSM 8797]
MLAFSVFPFMRISAGSSEIGIATIEGSARIEVDDVSHPRSAIGLKPVFKLELQTMKKQGVYPRKGGD